MGGVRSVNPEPVGGCGAYTDLAGHIQLHIAASQGAGGDDPAAATTDVAGVGGDHAGNVGASCRK